MDTTALEGLGLSKGEISVYLSLLELGETKIGAVIEKSGMASSAVHNSVNNLIEKGLISYIKKGKIKYYQSAPPKQILDFIEDKKKNLQNILPQLEERRRKTKEKQEAEIFEGVKGVMTMLNILIEDAKRKDEYLFFPINVKEQNKEIQKFFEMYDVKRKAKDLIVKGLSPLPIKNLFEKRKILNMKYPGFPIPSNISICNGKIAFFSWGEKPIGYLIKSQQISDMYRDFFHQVWDKIKK